MANDHAGRIKVSLLALFILCLICACGRFYIRIRIQKRVSIDDGFLLFGLCCITTALVLLYMAIDTMYVVEAILFGSPDDAITPPDFLQKSFDYQKLVTIALTLTWLSIASVKFSFLFFFRKLIDRIRSLMIYWWCVTIFIAAASLYGSTVYCLVCPYWYNLKSLQCLQGPGSEMVISLSTSHMILDIVGDALILLIPIQIIWRIQVGWTQKIALTFSLCLTAAVIIATVIRISGLRFDGKIDPIWEMYWQYIAAEVGLTMTSVTTFRVYFVSRCIEERQASPDGRYHFFHASLQSFKRTFSPIVRQSRRNGASSGASRDGKIMDLESLPRAPHGTITGIRSIIQGTETKSGGNLFDIRQDILTGTEEDSLALTRAMAH